MHILYCHSRWTAGEDNCYQYQHDGDHVQICKLDRLMQHAFLNSRMPGAAIQDISCIYTLGLAISFKKPQC